jgi:hypothetical protein
MERLAYIGSDRALYLGAEPGSPARCLSADGAAATYVWPAWDPAGEALAVMRLGPEETAVQIRAPATAPPRACWTSRSGGPVYLGWAPNGESVAILVQDQEDLHLIQAPRDGPPATQPLVSGAPLYWDWLSDASALIVHVGGHHQTNDRARVLLFPFVGSPADPETLTAYPLGFRAPACEPGTQRVAYAATVGLDRRCLVLTDLSTRLTEEIAPVGDEPAFVWAPGGGRLVLLDERDDAGVYASGCIVDVGTDTIRQLPEPAVAAFWLPDGNGLLTVAPAGSGGALAWHHLALDAESARPLAQFTPPRDLALLLGHFDQYAHSHALCSAASGQLVFPSLTRDGRQNGHQRRRADLWLLSLAPPHSLTHVAAGTLAFFAG